VDNRRGPSGDHDRLWDMSFQDLPDNVADLPITDPAILDDMLDLFVSAASREAGALYLLLCDGENRVVVPIVVDDMPVQCREDEAERLLDSFVTSAATLRADLGVMLAIARPGSPEARRPDRLWLTVAERVCDRRDVRLLGVHVVTPAGSQQVRPSRRAA
jgi:hypothetical protein